LFVTLSAGKKARVCEAYACALVLSGRRAKKPIHDGSQKNELNGYENKFIMAFFRVDLITLVFGDVFFPADNDSDRSEY
jgi:hypothetical protein